MSTQGDSGDVFVCLMRDTLLRACVLATTDVFSRCSRRIRGLMVSVIDALELVEDLLPLKSFAVCQRGLVLFATVGTVMVF